MTENLRKWNSGSDYQQSSSMDMIPHENNNVFVSVKLPKTVKVEEAKYCAQSIVKLEPGGKAAQAYLDFCKEYLDGEAV